MKIQPRVLDWLLEKEHPSVRYYTLVDLLDRKRNDLEAREALSQIPRIGWAAEILSTQAPSGNWESLRSLYRPKYTATNWRAIVLADLGITAKDARIGATCDLFFEKWLSTRKPSLFDDPEVCVVGNLARTLARFGYADDARVRRLFDRLVSSQKDDGGWHCFPSDNGSLDCWEGLAAYAALQRRKWTSSIKRSVERGVEFYLERQLCNDGQARYEPWFRFHYPVHYYYDLLVGLDTITSLGYGKDERRLDSALEVLKEKRRADGTWNLDAVHPDLGRGANYGPFKKRPKRFALEVEGKPSKWITLVALRILKRIEED